MRRAFNLKSDLAKLEALLSEIGDVALIVIDPVTAYLGDCDSHKNAEIRALIAPLSDLAAKHGAAVVCVSHLNKAGGSGALMRVTGSTAFVAASRAAYLVSKDSEGDGSRRLFLPMKNNIGNDQTGLAFAIESADVPSAAGRIETSRIKWETEAVTVTADEAMSAPAEQRDHDSAKFEAAEWLREALKGKSTVDGKSLKQMATESGISERTLYRAAAALNVKMLSGGFGKPRQWHLCAMSATNCHVCLTQNVGTHEKSGTHEPPSDEPHWEEF